MLLTPLVAYTAFQEYVAPESQPFMPLTYDLVNLAGLTKHYALGALFAIHLIGFTAVSATFTHVLERLARPIKWIAGATFSVYLVHLPTMFLLAAMTPFARSSPANAVFLIAGSLIVCVAFAAAFERQKNAWRRAFTTVLNTVSSRLGLP